MYCDRVNIFAVHVVYLFKVNGPVAEQMEEGGPFTGATVSLANVLLQRQ